MKRVFFCLALMLCFCAISTVSFADTKEGEKAFVTEMKTAIPADRIISVDALHSKWEKAEGKIILLDVRTEAEFDCGHIINSNNIDSGHAYTMPKIFPDANTEIYVYCRTQHRATYFTGMLYKYGYKNVYLVEGGIVGWAEKGYPLVNKYMGEIKVTKYEKELKEEYQHRDDK
ncbi:MAG: rhodanese-like domain-containing protein [Proteobacteria bacterium]|nr:rhodanese-like domain-containing protein [Pseudomonadota bacterium]